MLGSWDPNVFLFIFPTSSLKYSLLHYFVFWIFRGHTQKYLGATLGSALRNYSWKSSGDLCDAKEQTWVSCTEGKYPPHYPIVSGP